MAGTLYFFKIVVVENCERAVAPVQVSIVQCPPRKRAHHKDWFSIGPKQ